MKGDWRLFLLSRPWIDAWCLFGLKQMLATGRAWAAASFVNGHYESWIAELGVAASRLPPKTQLDGILQKTVVLSRAKDEAQKDWERAVFSRKIGIAEAEFNRKKAAYLHWSQRWDYRKFAKKHVFPLVKRRDSLTADQYFREDNPSPRLFCPPATFPDVERSGHHVRSDGLREYWIRFLSDSEDYAYARILEPTDTGNAAAMPSIVYGHGLAMELEMLNIPDHFYASWARQKCRVILPDAPGHNRRVAPGYYGGESFLIEPPRSNVNHFAKVARETAVFCTWARNEGSQKIAIGGISLGALSAQLSGQYAHLWPHEARPDAILLVTTTAEISRLALTSAISRMTGLDRSLDGWDDTSRQRLSDLLDAKDAPPLNPDRIIVLLGNRDNITAFPGGKLLVRKWQIPTENCFIRRQGHFSAAFGFQYNPAPLDQLLARLNMC